MTIYAYPTTKDNAMSDGKCALECFSTVVHSVMVALAGPIGTTIGAIGLFRDACPSDVAKNPNARAELIAAVKKSNLHY